MGGGRGARIAGVFGGVTAVESTMKRCASVGASSGADEGGPGHDACVSMAGGMHRAPAEWIARRSVVGMGRPAMARFCGGR